MKGSVRSSIILLLVTSSLLLVKSSANAIEVKIESKATANGGGTATSTVNSTVHSTSTNTVNETKSQTDIVVEANGVRKEYHSDKPGNVDVSVENGQANVNVTNDSDNTSTSNITVTSGPSAAVAGASIDAGNEVDDTDVDADVITPKAPKVIKVSLFQMIFSLPQQIFAKIFGI